MRLRYVAVSAAAVAVLGLAAGCTDGGTPTARGSVHGSAQPSRSARTTDDGGGSDRPTAVQRAYHTTTDAKTAKVSMTGTITGGSAAGSTTMRGVVRFSPPAERLTIDVAGRKVEAVLVDGYQYVRVGSSWHTVDVSELTDGAVQDPTRILAYLQGVSSSVHRTGTRTIRGVRATGYRATIDVRQAAATRHGKAAEALRRLARQGTATIPVRVWLDPTGRVVREHSTVTTRVQGRPVTVDNTIDLYDYGTPVHITRPAGA